MRNRRNNPDILRVELDAWGESWDVHSERPTQFGWPAIRGWPHGVDRARGCVAKYIITKELLDLLEKHKDEKGAAESIANMTGISVTTIGKMRRKVGHNYNASLNVWWRDRILDLLILSAREFSEKHGVQVQRGAVNKRQRQHLGLVNRPAGWWTEDAILDLLRSDEPTAKVARRLNCKPKTVRSLRYKIIRKAKSKGGQGRKES